MVEQFQNSKKHQVYKNKKNRIVEIQISNTKLHVTVQTIQRFLSHKSHPKFLSFLLASFNQHVFKN